MAAREGTKLIPGKTQNDCEEKIKLVARKERKCLKINTTISLAFFLSTSSAEHSVDDF